MDTAREITRLNRTLPRNQYGLPEGIYRADLITVTSDEDETNVTQATPSNGQDVRSALTLVPNGDDAPSAETAGELHSTLDPPPSYLPVSQTEHAAFTPLSYSEGFPTLAGGIPFWSKLEWEPHEAYVEFQRYLLSGAEGARQLFTLVDDSAERSLQALNLLSTLYYWIDRSKSFDLFKIAESRRAQFQRALHLEDDHYLKATRLLDVCMAYLEGEDFSEELTPKVAIDLLKVVTQLQRVSSGLPGAAPRGSEKGEPIPTSLEVVLRTIAGQGGLQHEHGDNGVINEAGQRLDIALNDPKTAEMAQELIIRINQGSQ